MPRQSFATWLADLQAGGEMDVPCGGCQACCTSGYFIHVEPDETDTLRRIPKALLFPAPGMPKGHRLMGFDEHGRCPMLGEHGCTIYDDRPRACRRYDCRVFSLAGAAPGLDDKPLIAEAASRWTWDDAPVEACRAAARFLRERALDLPTESVPRGSTDLAVLAITLHALFLDGEPTVDEAAAAIERARRP